jgi:2'-5' RNA ligase
MRLFVGLEIPWDICQLFRQLTGAIPGARWVPAENYHLTLRFIGEVPAHRGEEIDMALLGLRARQFPLIFSGVGIFEKAGVPNSLWVGVEKNPALDHLQGKIETALQRVDVPAERRRFSPHVTLARLNNAPGEKLAHFMQTHNLFKSDPIMVTHFTIFSSLLGKEASVYNAEAEYDLQ